MKRTATRDDKTVDRSRIKMQFEPTWKFDCVATHGGALTAVDIDRPRNVSQPLLPPVALPQSNNYTPLVERTRYCHPRHLKSALFPSSGIENSRGDAADNFLPRDQIEGELGVGDVLPRTNFWRNSRGNWGKSLGEDWQIYRWNNFVRGLCLVDDEKFQFIIFYFLWR